jgi:hypothetical protein
MKKKAFASAAQKPKVRQNVELRKGAENDSDFDLRAACATERE